MPGRDQALEKLKNQTMKEGDTFSATISASFIEYRAQPRYRGGMDAGSSMKSLDTDDHAVFVARDFGAIFPPDLATVSLHRFVINAVGTVLNASFDWVVAVDSGTRRQYEIIRPSLFADPSAYVNEAVQDKRIVEAGSRAEHTLRTVDEQISCEVPSRNAQN